MKDRKGQGSRHLTCMSVEESLYGRLVMVHRKAEGGHIWKQWVDRQSTWCNLLQCSECCRAQEDALVEEVQKIIRRTGALVIHPV